MGLIKRRKLPLLSFIFPLLFFLFQFPVLAQNAVPLASELSRFERLTTGGTARERYDAYMALAQLQRLSGNSEAALRAYEGALALFPRDGKALLEQTRLLISFGEYESAVASAAGLMRPEQEREFFVAGRYLSALAEAFHSGNVQALAALAGDADFSEYLGAIYYTIWHLSGVSSYRNRLTTELPQSPEAGIAAGRVLPIVTPLWLLFPGRESIVLLPNEAAPTPATQAPAAQTPAPVAQAPPPQAPATQPPAAQTPPQAPAPQPSASQTSASQTSVLQTNLFSRLENAQNHAETLKNAGFSAEIVQRQVNGVSYWAVIVPYGSDMNAMIRRLRDAGFDSFPINL